MLQYFKRIILFAYLMLMRWSERRKLLDKLVPNYKKKELDIAELPAVLDELQQFSKDFCVETSLSGFNSQGLCINGTSRTTPEGLRRMQLDLDIPGHGYFCHKELVPDCPRLGRTSLKCLDPMRRWQVKFHGLLRHVNAGGKKVNASIFMYWQCLFDPYDFLLSPLCWSLAKTLSCLSWRTIITTPLFDNGIFYNQWGELRGRIRIEGLDELKVKLKSVRERDIKGKGSILQKDIIRQHFVLEQSGLSFSQQAATVDSDNLYFGRVTFPVADSTPSSLHHSRVSNVDDTSELLKIPQQINISSKSFDVQEELTRPCFRNHQMIGFAFKKLMITSQTGYGIEINKTKQAVVDDDDDKLSVPTSSLFKIRTKKSHSTGHIVSLDNESCISRSLVGGKAYNLALVNSLENFNVPKGLVITTDAFENYLMKTLCGIEASKRIKGCLTDDKLYLLKQHCEQAVQAVRENAISEKLRSELEKQLAMIFGEDWYKKHYAVRSSGVGEDSVQTSAAGQLETFLGIQGLDNILTAVRNCWASSFAYQVVEYRRQNGQELLDSMGVVIQEMVNADVSGVVFTIDPVDNDASKLVITANYGLGESVVSGDVDADTIVVDRHDENNLVVNKSHKGKKETKTVADDGEVKTIHTTETEKNAFCMEDKQIILLSKQVLDLENSFGTYLDIEWALQEERVHILQARPITSLDLATDDDLIHEFDSPLASDHLCITSCNIQEMMPGAVPTLTGDLFIRGVDIACNYSSCSRIGVSHPVHAISSVAFYCGFGFLNLTHFCIRSTTCFGDGAKTDTEVSFIGQEVKEHTLQTVKDFIGRNFTSRQRIMTFIRVFVTLKRRDSILFEQLKKKLETLEVGKGVDDSQSLYRCIDNNLIFYFNMWLAYIFKASESVVPSGIAIMFLKKGATDIDHEAMADMALILDNCGEVESAEVPLAIHDLAECIARSNIKDQFLATPNEDCDVLLRNATNADVQATYIRFMEKHGHRGIREADLMEKSWSQDPRILIESVKQLVIKGCFKKKEKVVKTTEEIVSSLQANLNWLQRLLLKWSLVKSAKAGVAARELGKSVIVKSTYIFKVAYWRLAELMVCENRLPEQELLFFLTHREIGELIESRSASLIRLAKRRKRIFSSRNNYSFPKVSFGYPQPLQMEKKEFDCPPSFTLYGMPVCRGRVEGRACVIKTLDDVSSLKAGDVMICKYTDVGWSPYFPMISGLVTEIGGLISHGAVVARECGIPSIVNTANATDMIRTGDRVVVDGTVGTVSKL